MYLDANGKKNLGRKTNEMKLKVAEVATPQQDTTDSRNSNPPDTNGEVESLWIYLHKTIKISTLRLIISKNLQISRRVSISTRNRSSSNRSSRQTKSKNKARPKNKSLGGETSVKDLYCWCIH